jgi:hypothetical protein
MDSRGSAGGIAAEGGPGDELEAERGSEDFSDKDGGVV